MAFARRRYGDCDSYSLSSTSGTGRYSLMFRDHTLAKAVAHGLDSNANSALVLVDEQVCPADNCNLTEEAACDMGLSLVSINRA
jgi:hypothetical protein